MGYFGPLVGSVLGIVFVALNGNKFGHNKVPVKIGDDIVKMNGPPEYYLICFWSGPDALACAGLLSAHASATRTLLGRWNCWDGG